MNDKDIDTENLRLNLTKFNSMKAEGVALIISVNIGYFYLLIRIV